LKNLPPFIIYALPRSRTFWLSRFLSHGPTKCGHDELRHVRGMDDVKSLLDMPNYGSAETAAAPWWRLIHTMRPDLKVVIVRRPVADVVDSIMATGVAFDRQKLVTAMTRLDAKLDQIGARVPGALEVGFEDLNNEAVCAQVFEHCTVRQLDPAWFAGMSPLRLTVDLEAQIRYYQAHLPQLERTARTAKQAILAKVARRPVSSDAITFQQEPFDVVFTEGRKLFEQHCVGVGERPDSWETKNLDLMRTLEKVDALYVTTARCNGRLYGYLMSIVAAALDTETGIAAVQTLFYVSPDAPGIGLKLQRASIDFLRTKGVDQVAFRAGPRGHGEKISAIFKRLGAQDAGLVFTLNLKEAA
jgi:hypothetical protein